MIMTGKKRSDFQGRAKESDLRPRRDELPPEDSEKEDLFAEIAGDEAIEKDSSELDEARKEATEHYDKYLRLAADFDNFKRRTQRDRADLLNYGNESIIKDILPIVDNLERALEHASDRDSSESAGGLVEGVNMILEQMKSALTKHGVEPIEAVGNDFDPNYHEAMLRVDRTDEYRDNQVVSEFEKGYVLNGRLLRPSKVSVAKQG